MKIYELQEKLRDYAEKHGDAMQIIDDDGEPIGIGEGSFANGTPALVIF